MILEGIEGDLVGTNVCPSDGSFVGSMDGIADLRGFRVGVFVGDLVGVSPCDASLVGSIDGFADSGPFRVGVLVGFRVGKGVG